MLTVQSAPPELALRPYIRAYVQREAHLGSRELVEPVVARLGVMLEFEFAGTYEVRNYSSETPDDTFLVTIIGPQTWRRARLIIRNHVESLVVMFQPSGFHALFGTPTYPLSETGTEAHSVLGPAVSRLHQRLGNLPTFTERRLLLDQYFCHQLRKVTPSDPVRQALHQLTLPSSGGVANVARQMGINLRHLERKSLAYSGVSPKSLIRIARFSRALRLHAETQHTWTRIAHHAGYHDHMHLIRDFRIFAGGAPTSALEDIAPDHLINFSSD